MTRHASLLVITDRWDFSLGIADRQADFDGAVHTNHPLPLASTAILPKCGHALAERTGHQTDALAHDFLPLSQSPSGP